MKFVGIDLHSKTIVLCVANQEARVVDRRKFACSEPERVVAYFKQLGRFQAVVEATASYEWLWQLLEPLADRLVLAHPKKLRVIAESTRKSDRFDAQVLAEFLARGMIPQAYRPTPRQRAYRTLVRQRCYLQRSQAALKVKIRRVLSHYNADRRDLFTAAGLEYLAAVAVTPTDRLVLKQLLETWAFLKEQVRVANGNLKEFGQSAPAAEAEARAALATIPGVGPVTVDVIVSELADVRRFRSTKEVVAYAGLCPCQRVSAETRHDLGISKEGSRLLRWVLVEAAWRLVRNSPRWEQVYLRLRQRRGSKKAIVAVARRLLTVVVAVWRSGQRYRRVG